MQIFTYNREPSRCTTFGVVFGAEFDYGVYFWQTHPFCGVRAPTAGKESLRERGEFSPKWQNRYKSEFGLIFSTDSNFLVHFGQMYPYWG